MQRVSKLDADFTAVARLLYIKDSLGSIREAIHTEPREFNKVLFWGVAQGTR